MNEIDFPWVNVAIGLIFIVLIIAWGRFMSGFRSRRERTHDLKSEWRDLRKQMSPKGYRILLVLSAVGFILLLSIRLLQLFR